MFVVVLEARNLYVFVVVLELEDQDRMLGKDKVEQHHMVTFVALMLQELVCSKDDMSTWSRSWTWSS